MTIAQPDFLARAKAHWTPEREVKVTGGKDWLLKPSDSPELLRTLGLLNADASMAADAVRKFSQINHMLALLWPSVADLAQRHACLHILDACCGTSHLSLILATVLEKRLNKPYRILGIDANAKVVATSAQRADKLGLASTVKFAVARMGDATWPEQFAAQFAGENSPRPHLIVALHACDTATDQAMALGIRLKADAMAFSPCCHAELARKWKAMPAAIEHPFAPIFHTPNLRRETAAQITDTMRMLLIRSRGYEVTATEFVPSIHTPKNRLLLCTRRGNYLTQAAVEYESLKGALVAQGIALEDLLKLTPGPTDGCH